MKKQRFDELIAPVRDELIANDDDFLFAYEDETGIECAAGLTDAGALILVVQLILHHKISFDVLSKAMIDVDLAKKGN